MYNFEQLQNYRYESSVRNSPIFLIFLLLILLCRKKWNKSQLITATCSFFWMLR